MSFHKFPLGVAICMALALWSGYALAASARWTGKMEFVTTVTYKQGISCEYDYLGRKFWRTFVGISSCPSSIEVQ